MMNDWTRDGWGWGAGFLVVVWLLLFLLIVGAVVAVVAAVARQRGPLASAPSPRGAPAAAAEAILRERFARGEIDDEEFQRRLETLRRP
jgi:putative membrane protein